MPVRKSRVRGSSRRRRATLALLLAGAILVFSGPRPASADEDFADPTPFFKEPEFSWDQVATAGAVALDVMLLRPVSAVALVVGCIFFVASAPVVAPFEGFQESYDTFVYPQYHYAFERELGDL